MEQAITIALDTMGGDIGPAVTVPAAIQALDLHDNLRLILVGPEEVLSSALQEHRFRINDRLSIHHASQTVGMDELPSQALRGKKD
jgi:glycerol-3-phosphate acyltransferase PlsX